MSDEEGYWCYGLPKYIGGIFKKRNFKKGDLVMTIMGDYGIVIGPGAPEDLKKVLGRDNENYYKVLINGQICHYLSYTLRKIKN